jgi:hypothetical protein
MFGRLYKHAWDADRFLFVRSDLRFPVAAYTKRNWTLVAETIDAADLGLEESALHRGWYVELREDMTGRPIAQA